MMTKCVLILSAYLFSTSTYGTHVNPQSPLLDDHSNPQQNPQNPLDGSTDPIKMKLEILQSKVVKIALFTSRIDR